MLRVDEAVLIILEMVVERAEAKNAAYFWGKKAT